MSQPPASHYLEIDSSTGQRIACRHLAGLQPGVLFCAGFRSDMEGGKALALEAWCRQRGRQFTRFDYSGHGRSSGRFEDGTIGAWRDDAIAVLDCVAQGPQLLVGSSMGGWMSLLMTIARPARIVGLLGVATAPDFTRYMVENRFSDDMREQLQTLGYCELPNEYGDGRPHRIRQRFLDESRDHMLLQGQIPIDVPVRLIHGQRDEDVPWQRSIELMQCLAGDDSELLLVKAGDHRLSEPGDLQRMLDTLERLLQQLDAGGSTMHT